MNIIISNKNLFSFPKTEKDAAVVTTNGIVKKNGLAVMGAGIARSARDAFPGIDKELGYNLTVRGNHAYHMGTYPYRHANGKESNIRILTMPTKHDWRDKSDIQLIQQSCEELMVIANMLHLTNIYLPAPGCSNGQLDWESQVRPVIEPILDDRFTVVVNVDNRALHKAVGLHR